jgi:uncharacterized protein
MSGEYLSGVLNPYASGVRLTVRAKPGAAKARDIKIVDIGNGKRAIEISVTADAHEGKANQALIERLADELGISKNQITIKSGETSRLKIIEIEGDPQILSRQIATLLSILV